MDLHDFKVIASYTRAEAIADGYQVPVPNGITKEAGIKFPVFFTRGVWDKYVVVPQGMPHQNEDGRLWDILFMFSVQARKTPGAELMFQFCCQLPDAGNWTKNEKMCEGSRILREITLKAVIGPLDIDDPSPAITVLFPDED
jgi:hypothetical protein